ncbi:MAG: hypothetical protein EBX61_05125, partial [Betaproteobacteria bacterium]|nr:hypothetical protein [Betaproteobacteria bacterium]
MASAAQRRKKRIERMVKAHRDARVSPSQVLDQLSMPAPPASLTASPATPSASPRPVLQAITSAHPKPIAVQKLSHQALPAPAANAPAPIA